MSLNFCPCKIPIPYDASYVYDACNVLVKSYSKSIVATTHCIVLVKSTTGSQGVFLQYLHEQNYKSYFLLVRCLHLKGQVSFWWFNCKVKLSQLVTKKKYVACDNACTPHRSSRKPKCHIFLMFFCFCFCFYFLAKLRKRLILTINYYKQLKGMVHLIPRLVITANVNLPLLNECQHNLLTNRVNVTRFRMLLANG